MYKPNITFAEIREIVVRALKDNKSPLTDFSQGSFAYTFTRAVSSVFLQQLNRTLEYVDSTKIATAQGIFLDDIGVSYGIPRKQGSKASGSVLAISLSSTNHTIAPNSTLIHLDTGLQFKTINVSPVTVNNLSYTPIPVESIGVGSKFNLPAGTELVLRTKKEVEIYVGNSINSDEEICGYLTGGEDWESDEAYRSRIVSRIASGGVQTKTFIEDKLVEFYPNSTFFVKTEVGGFVEVWLDSSQPLSQSFIDSVKLYLEDYIAAGTEVLVKQLSRVYVDVELFIEPILPADYQELTDKITTITIKYIDSLVPGRHFMPAVLSQLLSSLGRRVVVVEPSVNVLVNPHQKIMLRELDIKYETR